MRSKLPIHWRAWHLHRLSTLWQGSLPPRTAPTFPIGVLVHFSFFLLNNEGLGRILEGRRCLDGTRQTQMEVFGAQDQSVGLRLSHCLAPALLAQSGRGRWGAGAEVGGVLSLPFHQEELGSRGVPPRESPCRIQSLRALDTPPRFHDLLKPEFMAPDIVGLPTPICLLGPCTPFTFPTLAPPQPPGSFASSEPGQILQSCG